MQDTCPVCNTPTPPNTQRCPTCGVDLAIARKDNNQHSPIEYKDQLAHSLGWFSYLLIGFLFANLVPIMVYLFLYVTPLEDISSIYLILSLALFVATLYLSTIGHYGRISLSGLANIFIMSFIPIANWWVAYYLGRGVHMQISKQKLHKPNIPTPLGLILIIFIAVLSILSTNNSANSPAPAPSRTATPARPPTAKPKPATSTPKSSCLRWSDVSPKMVGDSVCVYGIVSSVHANYQAGQSFIYFGSEDQFFITNEFKWDNLKGECLQAAGVVGLNTYQIPYIAADKFYNCETWMR